MNIRQELFCYHYVESSNGTLAAIKAGYSERTAKQQASRLLTYADVLEKIESIRDNLSLKHDVTLDKIVEELKKIAFSDLNDVLVLKDNLTIELRPNSDLNQLFGIKIVKSVSKTRKYSSFSINRSEKLSALVELSKILGLHDRTTGDAEHGRSVETCEQIIESLKQFV